MRTTVLARGLGFTEGPVVTERGLVCTSIDHGCLYEIVEGRATVLAVAGGGPNGAAAGADGELYVAQNGGRPPGRRWPGIAGGVQIVSRGGLVGWLTQDPVSPNDLCVGPDGCLYVTDPTRGRRDDGRLWRCDPATGEAKLLLSVPWYPNGIGFGREDDALYVASTGERRIVRFELRDGRLGRDETFARLPHGLPDGFAFDADGNLVVAAVGEEGEAGILQTFDRDGRLVDVLRLGRSRKYTNVAIDALGQLYVTDADEGAVLLVAGRACPGLPLHPFRRQQTPAGAGAT